MLKKWLAQGARHLISCDAFVDAIGSHARQIAMLDGIRIDRVDAEEAAPQVWALINSLRIVDAEAKMVSGAKALHALLPELVVPIDRRYTRTFFGYYTPQFQGHKRVRGQEPVFTDIFIAFSGIARATPLDPYVGASGRPWRTALSKIVDNALIAFCLREELPIPP